MDFFDTDKDGTVNFDEFLVGIRVHSQINDILDRANQMLKDRQ